MIEYHIGFRLPWRKKFFKLLHCFINISIIFRPCRNTNHYQLTYKYMDELRSTPTNWSDNIWNETCSSSKTNSFQSEIKLIYLCRCQHLNSDNEYIVRFRLIIQIIITYALQIGQYTSVLDWYIQWNPLRFESLIISLTFFEYSTTCHFRHPNLF